MLYLEDYLEMIEHLPQELRDRFTDMRELDLQVHNEMDSLEEQVKTFFSNAKKFKQEQRDVEFMRLKQEFYKTIETSDEKVNIANQIYDLVEKYLRRLDSELQKFKLELEADNAGITEILEKRSLELDTPSNPVQNHGRDRKRSALNSVNNNMNNSIRDSSNYTSNHSQNYVRNAINNNSHHYNTVNSSLAQNPGSFSNDNSLNMANNANVPNSNLSSLSCTNPTIAACASQAIAATHQIQGRRTASFKYTYEAINSNLQNMNCDFNLSFRDSLPTNTNINSNLVNTSNNMVLNNNYSTPMTTSTEISYNNNHNESYNRVAKRSRTANHPVETDDYPTSAELGYDHNEKRYCSCNEFSYGDMVACDSDFCQFEWFHYGCVGISHPPKGKWYCPSCTTIIKKRSKKEK